MVMKTGREWMLIESSKLQDCRQRHCVICTNVTVGSEELRDHKREHERRHERAVITDTGIHRSMV